ncbi:MAG: tetratricopeptide repeat protein [Nitrospiraceae bacterium]|nr:tetratricopeptide repeat protein [Nitrospiraceae bacterium]
MAIDRSSVLRSAQLFASRGQFDAAINEWKRLAVESPGDGSIFNSIGELHLKRQATNDAVAAFLQAANAFRAEGATLKAIATFKKILKLDPSRYDVFRHLGDLNAERGLLSSAVQDYLTLGKHYLKAGKSKDALDIYKKIVSRDPSNLDAQQRVAELCLQENMQDEATKVYLQLGRERSAQQRYAEAKDAYQAVLRIDPANSEAAQFIEHFTKTDGNPSRAKTGAGLAAKMGVGPGGGPTKSAEPPNLLSEATRRIKEKQFAGAEAILNQLLTKEPGNPEVCQLLAKLHLQRGDIQVALGEYRYLAGAALRAQHYEQAESLMVEFLAVEPNSVPILELYGELYEEKGDAANAVTHYGKATELLLQYPEPGMPTLHEELFEKIKSLAPDNPIVAKLSALMNGESAVEAPAPAAHQASTGTTTSSPKSSPEFSWTGAEPDDPWSVTSKVTPLQDRQFSSAEPEPAPAQSEPSPSTEPEPLTPDAQFSFSNAEPDHQWGSLSQGADSLAPLSPVLSTSEQFQAYIKAGQQAEAEEWLSRLVTAQPDHAEDRELFGSLLETKGDTAGAALQYSRALELLLAHPNDASPTQPASLYAKVKELTPASPLVAKWASTFSPKPQASAPAVETTVSAPPGNEIDPETHYTLGVAYKNMGLLDEAKEEFCLSMQSHDFFSDSCLMIAVCLKEQGECQSASTQLELLLKDPKCQGAKAQAISYELGLLYEAQEQWSQAAAIYESIPSFHDVPQRLESARAHHDATQTTSALRYAN